MLQALWDVAPPSTWAILGLSATLLLSGFILLSHALVRAKAYGDRYGGAVAPGRLEWTLRIGAACVLGGAALWAVELAAPMWVLVVLAVLTGLAVGLELVARRRS